MVNWKSKYLEMKLKYINAKNKFKGGMQLKESAHPRLKSALLAAHLPDRIRELISDDIAEEAFFDMKVQLINEFLELTWYPNNYGQFGDLTKTIVDFKEKLLCCYEPNYGGYGWTLTSSKIKENPNNIDFNKLATTVETMKNMGLQKNPYEHEWDGTFNDQ